MIDFVFLVFLVGLEGMFCVCEEWMVDELVVFFCWFDWVEVVVILVLFELILKIFGK